ncbi:MAG: aminotransferase class V-fold PLP-dependent enzyme, partial [Planctomycetes bacterium]|nr:aminotransferase class V-fold PLP-dependent enzyme [Planctomycetota bacterium]
MSLFLPSTCLTSSLNRTDLSMEKRETSNRYEWGLERGLTYLNHGSFGPAPVCVQEVREAWSRHIQSNPMQFFFSELEPALDNVIDRLGEFVRADSRNIVLVENATVAMNAVAETIELNSGDEVLLNDHEYGAVFNIWRRVCERSGARIVSISLGKSKELDRDDNHSKTMSDEKFVVLERRTDRKLMSSDEIIREIADGISPKTKLIVLSHVTSPTAIVFPVKDVCRMAREKKVPVCIDGPHAIAMCDVDLRKIECDFYCASLHKWLSAPFGAGFLFAHPRWHSRMTSAVTSWGRSLSGRSKNWKDQFHWLGTRDPSAFLAIPAAIDFLTRFGWDRFRQQTHELAQYARHRLEAILQTEASI